MEFKKIVNLLDIISDKKIYLNMLRKNGFKFMINQKKLQS